MSKQCQICGQNNRVVLEQHHLVPRRYGGLDADENMATLCGNCHNAIEKLYDDMFFERVGLEKTNRKTVRHYDDTMELVNQFLSEVAVIDDANDTTITEFYAAFEAWAENKMGNFLPHKTQFGKALRDTEIVDIEAKQKRIDGSIVRVYTNVTLPT